ncbi:MAG: Glu/Leu/Phe/Val dehydrogenase [Saprospiraceae bacterium]|nr:Glu/Leu/Phe/Val dehydrogenase [Saprospiraceae bacterium]MBK8371404.1 Glu/Leu/Phe/Val dehydrogenase [Saprospiraceae bacterium]MBK8818775.1 Glu/Leu/Phe/Val dehydrogenase [Saprospiraceae bacterium]MBK8853748.1 Glu/Leu/Phe/Val dehydrogenase [Saprospiraceae bacterium]
MTTETKSENAVQTLLEQYKEKEPEIVFEWVDNPTGAKGWIVINSLRNGAAGGGTRMRKGLTKDEVISLAKVMEIKFSVCGPDIGGAKSGIDFDPSDPRRKEVLKRWYTAVMPILKSYYGTGGDLNVDEIKDVVPITEDLGLWHPQEGIVNGHLKPTEGEKINIIGQLRYGVSKIIEDKSFVPESPVKYAIADMITGFGVAESVKHFYQIFKGDTLENKRVIIQGWGNVASAAAFYLSKLGTKIVGIIDRNGGILRPEGLLLSEVEDLFKRKNGNSLHSPEMNFEETNNTIWDIPCDIFIPGAASKIVSMQQMERLISNGLQVISCGANVPFIDDKIFFGETARLLDKKITLIPDFIANCGMARVFAYLMQPDVEMTDKSIFFDCSDTIRNFLNELYITDNSHVQISSRALELNLVKLMKK